MVKKNQLSKWMLGSAVAGLVISGASVSVTPSSQTIFQHAALNVGYSVAHAEQQVPAKDEKAKDEKTVKDEKAPAKDEKAKDEKTAKTKDASCGQGNCGANMKDEKAKTN